MAKIDYYQLGLDIQSLLRGDSSITLSDKQILVESTSFPDPSINPFVNITIVGRDAPDNEQTISASTRIEMLVQVRIVVAAFDAQEIRNAIERRDDAIGDIELVLVANPDLNVPSKVNHSWITGGELETGAESNFYIASGTIDLTVNMTATT